MLIRGQRLLPVTRDPHPAAGAMHPLASHPNRCRSWTHYPSAWHPDIVGSGPLPVTTCPDISRSRGHCLRLNPNCRWRSRHDNLLGWASCRHFSCGCGGRHCRRFTGATDKRKQRQRQQINALSHVCLLAYRFDSHRRLGLAYE